MTLPNSCSKTTTSTTICSTMDSTVCTPTETTTTRVLCTASTITSSVNGTIVKDNDVGSSSSSNNNIQQVVEAQQAKPVDQQLNKEVLPKTAVKTLPRPAKFIPPPPPPRRLLLTQTNLKTSTATQKSLEKVTPPQKSGVFADDGFSVLAATDVPEVCNAKMPQNTSALPCLTTTTTTITSTTTATTTMTMTTMTKIPQPLEDVYSIRRYSAPANSSKSPITNDCYSMKPRPSSTIIETSLLGSAAQIDNSSNINLRYKSSTIVSTMKEKDQQQQHQQQENNKEKEQQRMLTKRKDQTEQTPVTGKDSKSACAPPGGAGSGLSPRLEMRLALNHDIMGDEDLISYDPGPDLTTILGHDLSTFQRRTGRDLLNRSAMNRVQPKEAVISFSQQRNSKMDTPTVNRRPRPTPQLLNNNSTSGTSSSNSNYNNAANPTTVSSMPFVGSARVAGVPQHLQPNRNTWSSSVSVAHNRDESDSVVSNSKNISYNSGDSKLSDLEILARREKIYCMSQLRSGSQVKTMMTTTTMSTTTMKSNNFYNNNPLTRTTSTTSMGAVTDEMHMPHTPKKGQRQRKIGRDETALMEAGKANKLINFIKRRNSENPSTANNSQTSLNDSNASSTPQHKQIPMSPRKDNDKPSLNRRLWKQITKRRRSNSVSELVAT